MVLWCEVIFFCHGEGQKNVTRILKSGGPRSGPVTFGLMIVTAVSRVCKRSLTHKDSHPRGNALMSLRHSSFFLPFAIYLFTREYRSI